MGAFCGFYEPYLMEESSRTPSVRCGHAWPALLLCILSAHPLAPALITVEGSCSLVEAIIAANGDTPVNACPPGGSPVA